jgi:hypothetical protein
VNNDVRWWTTIIRKISMRDEYWNKEIIHELTEVVLMIHNMNI